MSVAKSERSTGVLFLRALLPVLVLAGGVAAFFVISHTLHQTPAQGDEETSLPQAKVATVSRHNGDMTIDADGVVVSYREINISSEVSGRIIECADICRAGNYVKEGELLVRVDPENYALDVERLEKELDQTNVALEELSEQIRGAASLIEIAARDLELRTNELTRLKKLGRTAISVSDLEKTEVTELAAKNTLVTLRNRVQLLNVGRARLESARDLSAIKLKKSRLDLARTRIVAPTDGVIIRNYVEEDSYVQPGSKLMTLEDTTHAEVRCKLQMEDLYWLWDQRDDAAQSAAREPASANRRSVADAYDIPDLPVEVIYHLAGHGDFEYVWEGRLERFDGLGLDEATRTVPCRVVVDQPRERRPLGRNGPPALLRGMYVTVRIQVTPETPLLEVPEQGVRPGNQVWCVRDGKLVILPVNFVTMIDDNNVQQNGDRQALVYVDPPNAPDGASSLAAGDQVIITPLVFVRTGMDIKVTQATKGARR